VKHIIDAIHAAAHESTAYMTADVQHRALDAGWHPDVAKSTSVSYNGAKFTAAAPDEAWEHEYGSQRRTPTPVLRKYSNSAPGAEEALLAALEKHVGVLL
jgi:hypothetical protein